MVERISIQQYLENYIHIPLVDVRSPGEYSKGHFVGAINIALFSNAERAEVGTVYKQESKQKAIELGYTFVNPKLQNFITESQKVAPDGMVAVHCWRGGMRSQAFADHLHENGFKKVYVIEKGYKAYRNHILAFFENKFKLKVLGGYTGSGKTDILKLLKTKGEQVVDLEGLANHKGSAFGGIGENEQPSSEQFENNLFVQMHNMDLNKPIWIEDESINIGKVYLPQPLFRQIRSQKVLFLNIPKFERAKYLTHIYGGQSKEKLAEAIYRITKRLGHLNSQNALRALQSDDLLKVAEISLLYYDKMYKKGVELRDTEKIVNIEALHVDAQHNANILMAATLNEL